MKNVQVNASVLTGVAILFLGIMVSGCKKETKEITSDDAADVVSYALQSSSGGSAQMMQDYSVDADEQSDIVPCGGTFDTTVSFSHAGTIVANYAFVRHYTLTCANAIPSSFSCSGTYNGSFDAPRMSSSNSGTNTWTISGLPASNSTWTFEGSLNRQGTHTSKVRNKYTFTSDLAVTLANVQVDKSTYQIVSGSGNISLSCSVDGGGTYNFTGSIVYNTNGTATLVINGNSYSITLY